MGPFGPDATLAAGPAGAAPAGGASGAGVQTGSTGVSVAAGAAEGAGLAACLRGRFCAAGVSAAGGGPAAAAAAGAGIAPDLPTGSGFIMLTAGIDAAVGKSMLTIFRGGVCPGAAGAAALASATALSAGWVHTTT